jgi:hypothetical protein
MFSALPRERTSRIAVGMSVSCTNPEVPTALDDLVGVAHLRKRHRQSQRSGGIEIDEQLNSGRLVNWQSTGLAPSFVFEIRLTEWCELAGRQARRLIF